MTQILCACMLYVLMAPLHLDDHRLAFESASKLDGEDYAAAKAELESHGQAIVPLLTEKSSSENWRERSLANALLFRIERPELAAQLRCALMQYTETPEVDANGYLVFEIDQSMVAKAKRRGENLRAGQVVFSNESLPIVYDCLRETNAPLFYRNTLVVIKHLKHPSSAEILFGCLARNAEAYPRQRWHHYFRIRAALLSLGENGKKVLLANSGDDVPFGLRCLAGGMLYELENPKTVAEFWKQYPNGHFPTAKGGRGRLPCYSLGHPLDNYPDLQAMAPLLIEIAVSANSANLNHFKKLSGNKAVFETLSWLLNRGNPSTILPLAEIDGARALYCYRQQIKKQEIHQPMVEPMIEGAILIGTESSDFLDDLAKALTDNQQNDTGLMVSQTAQQLRSDADDLAPLLEKLQGSRYRFLVAKAMAQRGDVKSLPLLMEYVQCAVDSDEDRKFAGRRKRRRRVLSEAKIAQTVIVSMGKPAIGAIRAAAKNSTGKYSKLFSESLILRIQNPDLARTTDIMLNETHFPGFSTVQGPDRYDLQLAGKSVAEQVGIEGVPLLEASIALSIVSGDNGSRVSAFALGELKQERSIPIIVDRAQALTSNRGEPLAGVILERFGAKGIEAAKKLEAADPSEDGR